MNKVIATIAIAGVASATSFAAEGLTVDGTFAFESEYVFRGIQLDDAAFQPGIELGYDIAGGTGYAGAWTSQGIANDSGTSEIDFYLGYLFPIDDIFTVDAGYTYYYYPDNSGDAINHTSEFYIGASADVLLSPALYFYYDIDLEATTFEGSIGHSFDLTEYTDMPVSLDLGAYLGATQVDDSTAGGQVAGASSSNGWTYYGVTADLVYGVSENVSATLGYRLSGNNDDNGRESNQWFGTTIGFSY